MPQILPKRRPNLKKPLIAGLVVLVVAVLVAGAVWYSKYAALASDKSEYNTSQGLAAMYRNNRNFDKAAGVWSDYGDKANTPDYRRLGYLNAGSVYLSERQFSKVIAECQKAAAIGGLTFDAAQQLAYAYEGLGNKKQAAYYFRQAAKLVPSTLSNPQVERDTFTKAAQELESEK